jgi:hypothetical protein
LMRCDFSARSCYLVGSISRIDIQAYLSPTCCTDKTMGAPESKRTITGWWLIEKVPVIIGAPAGSSERVVRFTLPWRSWTTCFLPLPLLFGLEVCPWKDLLGWGQSWWSGTGCRNWNNDNCCFPGWTAESSATGLAVVVAEVVVSVVD